MTPKIISFVTLKGGSGKTTLLMLTAAAIHNRTDKKLLVIDSDPQRSVKQIYVQENNKSSYDVFAFNWNQPNPEENFEKVLTIAQSKYDLIFMDLPPGRITDAEIYHSILQSDALIVPIVASVLDINATTTFLENIPEVLKNKKTPLEVYGVINKQDQSIEYKHLTKLAGIGGLQLFYSPLSNLVRYKRGISTVNDITSPEFKEDEFNMYFDEFCTKCFIV
ncbi:MAG: ParA family protein [Thermoflexibacter sp.]|jgi:chromosome partitioning protein|nr:ParA family protein [Thermoflexibacter sp.]